MWLEINVFVWAQLILKEMMHAYFEAGASMVVPEDEIKVAGQFGLLAGRLANTIHK